MIMLCFLDNTTLMFLFQVRLRVLVACPETQSYSNTGILSQEQASWLPECPAWPTLSWAKGLSGLVGELHTQLLPGWQLHLLPADPERLHGCKKIAVCRIPCCPSGLGSDFRLLAFLVFTTPSWAWGHSGSKLKLRKDSKFVSGPERAQSCRPR